MSHDIDGWHVPAALRREWVAGDVADEQAWSVETHLGSCAPCRESVAHEVAHSPTAALIRDVRGRLSDLPPQVALRPAHRWQRVLALLGLRQIAAAWAVTVITLLAGAGMLDLLSQRSDGTWIGAVAPLLPVLGLALAWGPGLDPACEISAGAPVAGLRFVLWRTAGLVVTAVPAAWALEAVVLLSRPGGSGAVQLHPFIGPALGLPLVTLAIGSIIGAVAAAGAVAAGWALGTLPALASGLTPALLADVPSLAWTAAGLAGIAVLILRRDKLSRLQSPLMFGGHA